MRVENVLGTHMIFLGILTVIHLYAGEPQWTAITLLISILLVYGVYLPLLITIAIARGIRRILKSKLGSGKGNGNSRNHRNRIQ